MSSLDLFVIVITVILIITSLHLCFKGIKNTDKNDSDFCFDKRSFSEGEVLWCFSDKYLVVNFDDWGRTLLEIESLNGCDKVARFLVDSREVKKIERVYAEISND